MSIEIKPNQIVSNSASEILNQFKDFKEQIKQIVIQNEIKACKNDSKNDNDNTRDQQALINELRI